MRAEAQTGRTSQPIAGCVIFRGSGSSVAAWQGAAEVGVSNTDTILRRPELSDVGYGFCPTSINFHPKFHTRRYVHPTFPTRRYLTTSARRPMPT